jgi:uncharacterized membrane protein YgaE (UPF0421/DUF939 family)
MFAPKEAGFLRQAVLTSASATLALYLAELSHLPEAYWAAVSAIIVMQSDIDAATKASVNRLAGTAIGALVGACAGSLFAGQYWPFAFAVFLAILICAVIGRWETYRFAGVTVAIVMLVQRHGTPGIVALHRFLEVSLGIVVTLIVTLASTRFGRGRVYASKN